MPKDNTAASESLRTGNLELFIQRGKCEKKGLFQIYKSWRNLSPAELHSSNDKGSPLSRKQMI